LSNQIPLISVGGVAQVNFGQRLNDTNYWMLGKGKRKGIN